MSPALIRALLRVVQATEPRRPMSKVMNDFVTEYGIGHVRGASLVFNETERLKIAELLRTEGVDPNTSPDAWEGLTRAQSLTLGYDDKATRIAVQRDRVAIKSLPGYPLKIAGTSCLLPPGTHLSASLNLLTRIDHDSVLLVENFEAFDQLHRAQLDFSSCGDALVLWRGDRDTAVDSANRFLQSFSKPVHAWVDYDPAGLLIASRLPRLGRVVAPPAEVLQARMQEGLAYRYRDQLPAAAAVLEEVAHPDLQALWRTIRNTGRALPQEVFIRDDADHRSSRT